MTVYLLGAGPGAPDLLTVRAAELLARADVVVHDRLVDAAVLALAAPWAELVDVGKKPGADAGAQDEIHQILLERADRYECVVRLKGGDPFVFGRGGEEAIALTAAGVVVEEVPGITSAIAAPAAAGIPVTMRGMSSGVSIITAHQQDDGDSALDWQALASSGTTLVIFMGASRAGRISQKLISAQMAPQTPVAVIGSATNADEQIRRCHLADLGTIDISNPATIVVGDVAALDVLADPIHSSASVVSGAAVIPSLLSRGT